jgi:hypothetical protein
MIYARLMSDEPISPLDGPVLVVHFVGIMDQPLVWHRVSSRQNRCFINEYLRGNASPVREVKDEDRNSDNRAVVFRGNLVTGTLPKWANIIRRLLTNSKPQLAR